MLARRTLGHDADVARYLVVCALADLAGDLACGDPVCARLVMRKHQPPSSITSVPHLDRMQASSGAGQPSRGKPAPKLASLWQG